MKNIIEYINEYQYPFQKRSFNDVDALVLSQFSYLKLNHFVPGVEAGEKFITLPEMISNAEDARLFSDQRYEKDNRALVEAMLNSRRFQNIKMNYFVDILNRDMELQFAAVTFLLDDGTKYLAFRGTDENLVGWKEDFTLAFSEPVIGQLCAQKYVFKVSMLMEGDFYIGGHSKGGNLAVFSAMSVSPSIQHRIIKIYSHDGPSFRPGVLEYYHYERIADKVCKILPKSSLVGMLLESRDDYRVIESSSFGLTQHNPYTWMIEEDHFVEAKELDKSIKWIDETVSEWILSLDNDQIGAFSEILFDVLGASEATNLIDLAADWKKSMAGIMRGMQDADQESMKFVQKILKSLFVLAQKRYTQEIQEKVENTLGKKF